MYFRKKVKTVQTFRAEPFISVKKPIVEVGIRHTRKLTVKVRLHVTCAREKHSYEAASKRMVIYQFSAQINLFTRFFMK